MHCPLETQDQSWDGVAVLFRALSHCCKGTRLLSGCGRERPGSRSQPRGKVGLARPWQSVATALRADGWLWVCPSSQGAKLSRTAWGGVTIPSRGLSCSPWPTVTWRKEPNQVREPCLGALDVPVLALGWQLLPGDLQLAVRKRVHLDVLRGHGWGWREIRTGGQLRCCTQIFGFDARNTTHHAWSHLQGIK
uniref:Uncharacterized protein n=1 Tax=Molossus molossus TaxID=27622 RepID=A0A7J8CZY6_MOLMO|nr:hypothetical protein HJG59_009558 [Molossus molossus]